MTNYNHLCTNTLMQQQCNISETLQRHFSAHLLIITPKQQGYQSLSNFFKFNYRIYNCPEVFFGMTALGTYHCISVCGGRRPRVNELQTEVVLLDELQVFKDFVQQSLRLGTFLKQMTIVK